jgi:hypothetical protein
MESEPTPWSQAIVPPGDEVIEREATSLQIQGAHLEPLPLGT